MAISTRFTEKFDLKWPIVSAPMAMASGGKLAAQVTQAGGFGLIGGGYGNHDFNEQAWRDAGNTKVGIGFITWSLEIQPHLLEEALEHSPQIVMLSFGDPAIFYYKIKAANAALMCQCQSINHVKQAVDAGADIIVAQGSEAGGHGALRGTLSFVPEVANLLQKLSPETHLLAAGGIGDGRGIAASLMLGAHGVLIGSRYWATQEAIVPAQFQQAAINATGDDTMRTSVPDVARGLSWPTGFDIRVLKNKLMNEYHDKLDNLREGEASHIAERYINAAKNGNCDDGGIVVGEVTGLISDLPTAAELTERLGTQTELVLKNAKNLIQN